MKPLVLSCFVLLVGVALAATEPPAPATAGELSALEQFLALDDAQLAQLQQAIARVRQMTPGQRAELRVQIAQFRQLPAPEREALRRSWGQESPAMREGWREMMQSLDEPARAEIRRRLEAASPEERIALRRELVERYRRERAGKR